MTMQNNIQPTSSTSPLLSPAIYTPRHYGLFVAFIALLGAFGSLVNDMYTPAIPTMMRQFHTTPSLIQMSIAMAMAGMGAGSLIWGVLSDRYGRKPILLISVIIFVVAAAVSLFSHNIHFFNITRFFQGLGAGGTMVLSTTIPADVYRGRQLGKLMGMVGAINGIAPAIGPMVGGSMTQYWGWKGIFITLIIIGAIMLCWTSCYKETCPPSHRVASGHFSSYFKLFKTLLANRRFMLYVLIKAAAIALLYAYIASAPFILQDKYGYTPLQFGLIFGGNAMAMALGATLAPRLKIMKEALVYGAAGMFAGACSAAVVMWHGYGMVWYELTMLPALFSAGMIFTAANTLSMDVAHTEAGTASALLNVVKYIFAAIVTPLAGLGNLMHSSALCFTGVSLVAVVIAIFIRRLSPLPDMIRQSAAKTPSHKKC